MLVKVAETLHTCLWQALNTLWSLQNSIVIAVPNTIKTAMAHNEKHRISNKPHIARMCSDTGRALEQVVKKACGARNIVK